VICKNQKVNLTANTNLHCRLIHWNEWNPKPANLKRPRFATSLFRDICNGFQYHRVFIGYI